jgi:DNA helicase-2/ATP-dependent DNA helicase PcrA
VPLAEIVRRYEDELLDAKAFDFDDLIGATTIALDRDPQLRRWAHHRARHLLVDEYQDTDAAQEALLRRLSPPPHDVCVVADPQQSIYAFRGAAPEAVHRFVERWSGAGVVRLEQNYRSTKNIVAIARRLVAPYEQAAAGLHLKLWTANPAGVPARLWVAPNPEREANAIAADVAARLEQGWEPGDIAVLVRTHAQARPLEAALLRARVPHVLVGGVRFFAREEIKDLLAYVRLSVLGEDSAAFWRIVNVPRRGLGPAALLTIARHIVTGTGGGPVIAARRWAATETAPDGLYDLLAHLDELSSMERSGAPPVAILRAVLRLTAYADHVRKQHPDDHEARLEGIAELERMAEQFDATRRFLDDAVLAAEDDVPATEGRVRLSTVHSAKGLEFRAVYVPGCELGLFPLGPKSTGAEAPPATDPEERRIFYVAVTRAKEALTLSYCTFRRDARTQPSPFLQEIGRGLIRRAEFGTDKPRRSKQTRRPRRIQPPSDE